MDITLAKKSAIKIYGEGIIMIPSDSTIFDNCICSTGLRGLDKALGTTGIPRERMIEIYGGESSSKTTLALTFAREVQKSGGDVTFIDVEHALDTNYAKNGIGVDVDNMLISQPDYGEQAIDLVYQMLKIQKEDNERPHLFIIDSVDALIPKKELDCDFDIEYDANGKKKSKSGGGLGLRARLMSDACRRLTSHIKGTNATIIWINQIRCIDKNSLIISNGTIKRLSELKLGDMVNNGKGKLVKVRNILDSGVISGVEITSKFRPKFRVSNGHVQPVISFDGEYIERNGSDVTLGDFMIHPILDQHSIANSKLLDLTDIINDISGLTFDSRCKKGNLPEVLNDDLAFLLGAYYSDGYLYNKGGNNYISFTENNRDRYHLIKDVCDRVVPEWYSTRNDNKIVITGDVIVEFFKRIGCLKYATNKIIPNLILRSGRSIIKSFIRGAFFDTHGFNSKGFIFTNENKATTETFSKLLYMFGIFGDVSVDSKGHDRINITGNDAVLFKDVIGFAERTKRAYQFNAADNSRGKYDIVPRQYVERLFKSVTQKGKCSIDGYNTITTALYANVNVGRAAFIKFFSLIEGYEDHVTFVSNNRFSEVVAVLPCTIDAMDIEVDGGLFVNDTCLTHNCKIGVMFGDPTTTSGGNALKFYASIRLETRHSGRYPTDGELLGSKVKVKVVKNKCAPPFKVYEALNLHGKGLQASWDLWTVCQDAKLITRKGSWSSIEGIEQKFQGFRGFVELMDVVENKEIVEELLN